MTVLEKAEKLIDRGECEEAATVLRNAELDNKIMENEGWRVAELFGRVFKVKGDATRAAAAYLDAAMKDRFLRAQRWHLSGYIFLLHYLQDIDTKELYKELAAYENLFADVEKFSPRIFNRDKIRVGYLLPYAKKSSLKNFIRPLFTRYNRADFEVFVYTFSTDSDEFTEEIISNASVFRVLSEESPKEAAKIIHDDELDILFDLAGHSEGGLTLSLLAYRPANAQIAGIGWPSALNLSFIDYVLSDKILIDNDMTDNPFTILSALCFCPDAEILSAIKRHHDITGSVKFGVFNNFMKITDEMLDLWKRILDAIPGATLTLQDSAPYTARIDFMKRRLNKLGFSSRVRVFRASPDYLQKMSETDIILDTHPYTGGNMTATALTLGIPVITLKGDRYGAKFSASILSAAACEDFIASSKEEYVKIAVKLANDENHLRNLRLTLSDKVRTSRLCDDVSYMTDLERVYREIVQV